MFSNGGLKPQDEYFQTELILNSTPHHTLPHHTKQQDYTNHHKGMTGARILKTFGPTLRPLSH